MAEHNNLRCALDLARACVHKGQAHQAFEHLRGIQFEIDQLPGSGLWVEWQVTYAGALAATNDPAAETAFEDALKRCTQLSDPDLRPTITAHMDYASYLAGRHATNRAKEHYRQAEKLAETLGDEECVAHCQNCIIGQDLVETKSPLLPDFQKLQRAAREGFTEVQQREAWIHYTQELVPQLSETRRSTSAQASSDYFHGMLSAIRRGGR